MMLIYNMTRDQLRDMGNEPVRSIRNHEFIQCEQVLTEHGICYTTNSFIAKNLSAKYAQVLNQIIIPNNRISDITLIYFVLGS